MNFDHWQIVDDHISNERAAYDIPLFDLASPDRVAFWVRQLSRKTWMTPQGMHNFASTLYEHFVRVGPEKT